jgi:hypothetical protein
LGHPPFDDFFRFSVSAILFQGRALGVTVGCLLGMTPLLFLGKKKDESNEDKPA